MLESLSKDLEKFISDFLNYLESPQIYEQITELKRDELFKGLRGDGNKITPNYNDVPAFAGWYLNYKKTLDTYKLGDGTPDLYIDGTFHNSLFTAPEQKPAVYITDSDYSKAFMVKVVEMHNSNGTLLDLTPQNIELLAEQIAKWVLNNFNV